MSNTIAFNPGDRFVVAIGSWIVEARKPAAQNFGLEAATTVIVLV